MKKAKKIFKILLKTLSVLLIIIILCLTVCFIVNKIKLKSEYQLLKEAGYVNRVSVGDYKLNVQIYGNMESNHTIVGMSGMGVTDFAVAISTITKDLSLNNKIAIVDRAGYGLSDDTYTTQTIERVVEDYRAALKNSGCQAPYILMAHSLGGVYATYWEIMYPDEVEAVVYIDPSQLGDLSDLEDDTSWDANDNEILNVLGSKLGLTRLYLSFEKEKPWGGIPQEKLIYSKALYNRNLSSFAQYSESKEAKNNLLKTYNILVPTDIPKLYIDTTLKTNQDVIDMYTFFNDIYISFGINDVRDITNTEFINETIPKILDAYDDVFKNYTSLYIEKLGNVTYSNIPGYHHIYLQKPTEVTLSINNFINSLSKSEN